MDSQFSERCSVATVRKRHKRRRISKQELPPLPESDSTTSGACKNTQKRETNLETVSVPQKKRGKIWGERQTGQFCEENKERRLRNIVEASRDADLSAANDNNVSHGTTHESTCTGKYSRRCRKRKRSPSHERNSSLDSPGASAREINKSTSNVSEAPAMMSTEQASTSRTSDAGASQRVSFRRQNTHREVRGRRSTLHTRSSRSSPLLFLHGAESAPEEMALASPLIAILSTLTEVGMLFGSLQGIYLIGDLMNDFLSSDPGLDTHGLSHTEINRLPTRCYSETGTSGQETFRNSECQICLCVYEEGVTLRTLPCLHEFHSACVDKWLKINHSCPVCRAVIAIPGDR